MRDPNDELCDQIQVLQSKYTVRDECTNSIAAAEEKVARVGAGEVERPERGLGAHARPRSQNDQSSFLTLAAAIHCVVATSLVSQALPVLVSTITARLHLTVAETGMLPATDLGGSVVSSILLTRPLRKVSLSRIMQAGLVLVIVANCVSMAAGSFALLAGSRVIAGLGEGIVFIAGLSVYTQARSVERVYAFSALALTTTAAAFMMMVPFITSRWGWGSCFGVLAFFALPGLWTAPLFRRVEFESSLSGSAGLNRSSWLVIVSVTLAFCGLGASWANLGLIGRASQMSAGQAGSAISLATFTSPTALVLVALLSGRVSNTTCIAAASGLMIVALMMLSFGEGWFVFTAAAVLLVFGWFLYVPPFFGVAASLDSSGVVSVIANACANGGFALGPLLAIPLLQVWGLGVLPCVTCLTLLAALPLVAIAAWALDCPTGCDAPRPDPSPISSEIGYRRGDPSAAGQ